MSNAITHRLLVLLLGAGALLWQAAAFAHSELPDAEWCSSGVPTPVAQFEIFPATLRAEREREQQCSAGKGLAKTCGQFDDDYGTGQRSAKRLCDAHVAGRLGPGDIGSVIAVVVSPASYLHDDHHALYSVEEGLQGICVRCERPRHLPVPSIRE
jgi:hypothetical protein